MIEAATPSPQRTPDAPRAETTPSFLEQMGRSVRQFAVDVAKANDDAREQLGRTAVGHILSGVAPLATGVVGEVVLDTLLAKTGKDQSGDSRKGRPNPFLLLTDAVNALNDKPFLKEVAKNVGVTVAYNQLVARPSEEALPPASAVDAGIAVGLDAAAIGAEKIGKKYVSHIPNALKVSGKNIIRGGKLANGPTVLGLRMMGEGIAAIAKNYQAIQHARSHPYEPKPYHPLERKPWEQRNRGSGRDFHDRGRDGGRRDRVYYGQGGGRYDRQYR